MKCSFNHNEKCYSPEIPSTENRDTNEITNNPKWEKNYEYLKPCSQYHLSKPNHKLYRNDRD